MGFTFQLCLDVLILHGYGEPFLDKFLIKRLEACKKRNIPTYFSCTPATMTVEKAIEGNGGRTKCAKIFSRCYGR